MATDKPLISEEELTAFICNKMPIATSLTAAKKQEAEASARARKMLASEAMYEAINAFMNNDEVSDHTCLEAFDAALHYADTGEKR